MAPGTKRHVIHSQTLSDAVLQTTCYIIIELGTDWGWPRPPPLLGELGLCAESRNALGKEKNTRPLIAPRAPWLGLHATVIVMSILSRFCQLISTFIN